MKETHTPFRRLIINLLLLTCALEFLFVGYLFYNVSPLPPKTISYTDEADLKAQALEIHKEFFSGFPNLTKQFYSTYGFYNAEKACLDLITPPKDSSLERRMYSYETYMGFLYSIFPQNFILLLVIYLACAFAAGAIRYSRYVFAASSLIVFSSLFPLPEIANKFACYSHWGLFYWTTPQLFFGAILLYLWCLEKVPAQKSGGMHNRSSSIKNHVHVDGFANLRDTIDEDSLKKATLKSEQQYRDLDDSVPMALETPGGMIQEKFTVIESMDDSETWMETSSKRSFTLLFLIGSIFSLVGVLVMWPEVVTKFGGLTGLLWSIYYNLFRSPLSTLPGLMFLSLPVFCIVLFKRYLYYKQLWVRIDESGIRMEPGNRAITWNQVEHILISPNQRSYTLTIRDDRPIYLKRHLRNFPQISFLLVKYLEPVLLENAMKHFHKQGSLSFGTKVEINNQTLFLNSREQSIPLEAVSKISLDSGNLQVKDLNNRLLYYETIESIPDAMIIPAVFKRINPSGA